MSIVSPDYLLDVEALSMGSNNSRKNIAVWVERGGSIIFALSGFRMMFFGYKAEAALLFIGACLFHICSLYRRVGELENVYRRGEVRGNREEGTDRSSSDRREDTKP